MSSNYHLLSFIGHFVLDLGQPGLLRNAPKFDYTGKSGHFYFSMENKRGNTCSSDSQSWLQGVCT